MFRVAIFALVVAFACADSGAVVAAQYRCDNFLCSAWSLEVSRVDTAWHPINLTRVLVNLLPESPVSAMSFPVSTAWDNSTRTFFVIGSTEATSAYLWSVSLNGPLTGGSIVTKSQIALSTATGTVVAAVHSGGSLYGIFSTGDVNMLDLTSGNATFVGNLFSSDSTYAQGVVTTAVDVDSRGNLYIVIETKTQDKPAVAVMDLGSGKSVINLIVLEHEDWFPEMCFAAVYSEADAALWTFVSGTDSGFDQIITIDPTTGKADWLNRDLSQNNIEFDCDMSTKACDMLQTVAYDVTDKKLYFQATTTGDEGSTALMWMDMNSKEHYINTAINPMIYGFMGFFYADISA